MKKRANDQPINKAKSDQPKSEENLLAPVDSDFDAAGEHDRSISGEDIIRCVDGHWIHRDGTPIPAGRQEMLVMGTTQALQHWQDGRPIETIWKMPGQPLPEAEALSAEIPCDEPFADGAMNVHCKHKCIRLGKKTC
jgi:hypothetical protein